MKVTQDETYESMMGQFQVIEIARLNEVLKSNGIQDKKLRESICSQYFDQAGSFLDSGSFDCIQLNITETSVEEKIDRVFPELVFSKRTIQNSGVLGEIDELIVPEYTSNFHEYASGTTEEFFNENEESLRNKTYE